MNSSQDLEKTVMFPSNSAPEWLTLLKREVSRAISALFLIAGYEGSDKLFKKSVVASAWSSWGSVRDIRLNKNKKIDSWLSVYGTQIYARGCSLLFRSSKYPSLDKKNSIFFILLYFKGVYEMLNLSKYFLIQFAYLFI